MQLLAEISRHPGVPRQGKMLHRTAVRAIIWAGTATGRDLEDRLLMVYSSVNRDYKFPGGGVEVGESHAQALRRELREECGAEQVEIGAAFGKVVEYKFAVEPEYDAFCMTSYYYICRLAGALQLQHLEPYEQALGFCPVWVTVAAAIALNQAALIAPSESGAGWTRRETLVLERIQAACLP